MTQLVLGAAGAAVGYVIGGPTGAMIGWTVGSTIGSVIAQKTQHVDGPRLSDLRVTGSAYGAPIAVIEGHYRTAGQIVWASDKYAITTTTSEGGKGGPRVETTNVEYRVDLLYLVSGEPIAGIARIWRDGKLVWNARADAPDGTWTNSAAAPDWTELIVYPGDAAQLPDPTIEAALGVGNVPAYRGRGTVMIRGLNLGSSGVLPNLTFEVCRSAVLDNAGADVVLQSSFAGNDSTDVSASAMGPAALAGGATLSGDALQIPYGVGPSSRAYWSGADGSPMGHAANTAWTLEAIVTPGLINDGYPWTLFSIKRNESLGGPFFSVLCYKTSGVYGKLALAADGSAWDYGPLTPPCFTGGRVHVALVVPAGSPTAARIYVDGVLQLTTASSSTMNTSFIDTHVLIEAGWNSSGVSGGTVHAIRKTNRELYTGTSFTPPTDFAPPDLPFPIVTPLDEPLADVVTRRCLAAGLTAGQIDVTGLAGLYVRGLAISQVSSPRSVLEALATAYQFDCVESGGLLKFVRRGAAPLAALPYGSMGATAGEQAEEPLPLQLLNDIEAPARITVRYLDADADYQDGAQSSDRLLGPSLREDSVELPLVLTAAEAKAIADIAVMDVAASQRTAGPVAVCNDYAALEPADVLPLTDVDGTSYRARILSIRSSHGVHALSTVIEDASILASTVGTTPSTGGSSVVAVAGDTTLVLLDIPLLRDDDDGPGFYAAVKGASPWPGCALYASADNVTWSLVASIGEATQIGTCTSTLGAWSGGAVFDEKNTVTVDTGGQALASWSRDDILAGTATGYVIGAELIYARTATLVSPGVYTLSGLLRGRRGTEWAIAGHGAGERFVALPVNGRGLRRVALDSGDIGVTRWYKAVTAGRALDTATAQAFACSGVSQVPFAPVDLRKAVADAAVAVTWKRRTRRATRFTGAGGISVPLGETSEAYTATLRDGSSALVSSEVVSSAAWSNGGAVATRHLTLPTRDLRSIGGELVGLRDDQLGNAANPVYLLRADPATGLPVEQGPQLCTGRVAQWAANGDDLYVASSDIEWLATPAYYTGGHVRRYVRTALGTVAATYTAATPGDPAGIAHDGTYAWMTESQGDNLRKLNGSTLASIATYAMGAELGRLLHDAATLWICSPGSDELVHWDIATTSDILRIATGPRPVDLVLTSANAFVQTTAGIEVYDRGTGALVAAPSIGTVSGGMCAFGAGYVAVVAYDGAAKLVLLDAATGAVNRTLRLAPPYLHAASAVDGTTLYLTTSAPGSSAQTDGYELAAPGLAGYTLTVAQRGALGDGYAASITL